MSVVYTLFDEVDMQVPLARTQALNIAKCKPAAATSVGIRVELRTICIFSRYSDDS